MTDGNSCPLSPTLWTIQVRRTHQSRVRLKFNWLNSFNGEQTDNAQEARVTDFNKKKKWTDIFAFVCRCLSSVIGHFRSARLWPEARHPSRPLARPAATAAAAVDDFRASLSPPFKIEHPHRLSTFFPASGKNTAIYRDLARYDVLIEFNAINLTT